METIDARLMEALTKGLSMGGIILIVVAISFVIKQMDRGGKK